MTIGVDNKGGGDFSAATNIVHGNVDAQKPDPGKTSKSGAPAIGVPIVDQGVLCGDGPTPDGQCFWDHEERIFAVMECVRRIQQAREAALHACDRVEFRILIEKSEDDLPPVLMFILGGLGGFLVSQLFEGVMSWKETFKKDPRVAMDAGFAAKKVDKITNPVSLGDKPISTASSIKDTVKARSSELIESVNATKLKSKFDPALDKGKEQVNKLREKVAERKGDKSKEEKLDFLGEVRTSFEVTYDALAQTLPAGATDQELAALIEAFEVHRHTIEKYTKQIVEKMDRFKKSQVSNIGRNNVTRLEGDHDDMPMSSVGYTGAEVTRDVKVEWHTYLSGAPKDLFYVYQDGHADAAPGAPQNPDSKGFDQTFNHHFGGMRASLDEGARIGAGSKSDDRATVPPEFWETAVTRHQITWNKEPETMVMDDSGPAYSYDPKRQQAAIAQKASLARAQVAADHAAAISLANQQAMEHAKHMGPQQILSAGGVVPQGGGMLSGSGSNTSQGFTPTVPPDQMKKMIGDQK